MVKQLKYQGNCGYTSVFSLILFNQLRHKKNSKLQELTLILGK